MPRISNPRVFWNAYPPMSVLARTGADGTVKTRIELISNSLFFIWYE